MRGRQVHLGQWRDGFGGRASDLRAAHPWVAPPMAPGYGGGVAYDVQRPDWIPQDVPITSEVRSPVIEIPPRPEKSGWQKWREGVLGWYDVRGPAIGHWQEFAPSQMGPGGVLVDAPPPTRANRDILPMSTGVPILPTQSAQITGRPQTIVFSINRFLISNAGTAGGAADWIVNDIKIGNRSQFVQSGDVPGDLFATNAIDTFVRFDTAQTAMDVVVVVTYIGLNECGAPFFGAMVGTAAV